MLRLQLCYWGVLPAYGTQQVELNVSCPDARVVLIVLTGMGFSCGALLPWWHPFHGPIMAQQLDTAAQQFCATAQPCPAASAAASYVCWLAT